MTKPVKKPLAKKPQTLRANKPAGGVKRPKETSAVAPTYFKALDLLMASVEYARSGKPIRAAKALADAVQDPSIDQAMDYLNDQQQQGLEQVDQFDDQEFDDVELDQGQMSKTLSRLIRGSQALETASEDDDEEDDEQDEEDDEDDEEEDDEDGESEESSTKETAGEDGEEDLDITMDQEDDTEEQQVQASVSQRLARAARNKARRA